MANNVTNIIHFLGDEKQIVALRAAVQHDEYGTCGIDFEKIIPMPGGLWMGGINPDTRAMYGTNNWLDWSVANWGTKWSAPPSSEKAVRNVPGYHHAPPMGR